MRYQIETDGKWVQPIMSGYKMSCCDCGLVHKLDFRIHKGRVQFRASRDNRATGQARRHRKMLVIVKKEVQNERNIQGTGPDRGQETQPG